VATIDMGRKDGSRAAAPLSRRAGTPSNTMTDRQDRTDTQDRQRSDSIRRTVLQTVAQKLSQQLKRLTTLPCEIGLPLSENYLQS